VKKSGADRKLDDQLVGVAVERGEVLNMAVFA
jgi:hypothetical protein